MASMVTMDRMTEEWHWEIDEWTTSHEQAWILTSAQKEHAMMKAKVDQARAEQIEQSK